MRWLMVDELGWVWREPFQIAGRFLVRLNADDLPDGPLVVSMRGHFSAVVDGKLRDTWDCSNGGRRVLFGYWRPVRSDA